MRSGELARLAGVTVRALRHYHQVGVLAEPKRGSNGYRMYDVHDLIRVLRIRRLASLGMSLDRMTDLLDEPGDEADSGSEGLLDELDAELAGQIDRLTKQRDLIAQLRELDAAPDLPPELAPFVTMFAAAGLSPELAKIDRDQSVLLAHFAGEDRLPRIAGFYQRLSDPALAPAVTAVSERFSRLGPESTEQDIVDLIDSFMTTFGPGIEELATSEPPIDLSEVADIFSEYVTDLLNEPQRRVFEELEGQLAESRET